MAKREINRAPYTVHSVLAGAYKGKDIEDRALLYHASQDDSVTALCKTVKKYSLCDLDEAEQVTCPVCLERIAARGLERKPDSE